MQYPGVVVLICVNVARLYPFDQSQDGSDLNRKTKSNGGWRRCCGCLPGLEYVDAGHYIVG